MRHRSSVAWPARAGLGIGLVAGAWYALSKPPLQRADVRLGDAVRRFSHPIVDRAVTATTDLGSVYAVLGCSAVLAAAGRRRLAADVLALGGTTWALAQAGKTRVRRQRPYEAEGTRRLIRVPTGSSFPSGHAAVGMAVPALLAEHVRGTRGRGLLYALGAHVGFTRVYVGVHYPTDVVGGAGVGLVIAALWRGPIAALGRVLAGIALAAARRLTPPALRGSVRVALGVRVPRRSRSER